LGALDAGSYNSRSSLEPHLRQYRQDDEQAVVDLSLRAWAPVFASMEEVLGREIFLRLHGDWRAYQERSVRETLGDAAMKTWVAQETAGPVIGFVAAMLHPKQLLGEIVMLAVDPTAQRRGVGLALTEIATDWLREMGMRTAMIGTGGDPGHAPARRLYAKARYTLMPAAKYFRAL
jgi:GNAT superfamily N-acetyltransferase